MTKKIKERLLAIKEELIVIQHINQEMLSCVESKLEETPFLDENFKNTTRVNWDAIKPIKNAVSRLQSSSSKL